MLATLLCGGCAGGRSDTSDIILASTTSLYDSGLLDALLPAFSRADGGARVRVVAVGSGQALALGRRGDADVLLVHAPEDEERFMRDGHGVDRVAVMRNDFVLVGPPSDPAAVSGAPDAASALRAIAASDARFISRGDSSGTHRVELRLWHAAGPASGQQGRVVTEVGQGMSETLAVASERRAYTLTDQATFVVLQPALDLVILHRGDSALINRYSVITVAGARNSAGGAALAAWLASPEAARLIRGYRSDAGAALFEPLQGH